MADDPEGGERDSLRGLIESDGWQRFAAYIAQEWGADASIRKLDDALKAAGPGEDVTAIVLQIRASALQIQNLVRWPAQRIAQLGDAKKSGRPFEALRRIGR